MRDSAKAKPLDQMYRLSTEVHCGQQLRDEPHVLPIDVAAEEW